MKCSLAVIFIALCLLTGTIAQAQTDQPLVPITPTNAGQLSTLAVLGHGSAGQALWSPDGKTLVVSSSVGVWLFDGSDLTAPPHLLASSSGEVTTIAFSPDSHWLAVADYGHNLTLWNIQTRELVQQVFIPSSPNLLVFNPDGKLLAGGFGEFSLGNYQDTEVLLWDTSSLTLVKTLAAPVREVDGLAFSTDGTLLAASALDESVRIWNVQRMLTSQDDPLLEDTILRGAPPIAFSTSGHVLAYSSGEEDHSNIKLWDVDKQSLVGTIPQTVGFRFDTMAFEGDRLTTLCACFDEDDTLLRREVWDLQSQKADTTEVSVPKYGRSLTYSPQDSTFVSTHDNGSIQVWDAHFHRLNSLPFFSQPISTLVFSPDGQSVFTGTDLTTQILPFPRIARWDVASALRGTLAVQTLPVLNDSAHLAISPDGKELASTGRFFDSTITLWQNDQQKQQSISVPGNDALDVAFSPDGRWFAGSTSDGVVKLWDAHTNAEKLALRDGPKSAIYHLKFSPDGRFLAVSYTSTDSKMAAIEFYDVDASLNAGKAILVHTLLWQIEFSFDVPFDFSSDGRVATMGDNSVQIWDTTTWTTLLTINHQYSVNALTFSPDGRLLATTTTNGINDSVLVWNAATGEQDAALIGHTADIQALAFNSDGTLLASGSSDGTVRLWGIQK